jgi:cardiolipin synthase
MTRWVSGNQFWLLENGEAFFPRVFEAIASAQREVVIETFILFEDKVGLALHAALVAAAARGVQIDITVDGFGSPDLSPGFIGALAQAGARLHVFDPGPRLWGLRTNVFRRLHRKIVVVDGERAFVGGINYSADHLADYGPKAKQDYAVEIEGPLVADIHRFARQALADGQGSAEQRFAAQLRRRLYDRARTLARRWRTLPAPAGSAAAIFVTRDNGLHTTDIERHYRVALRTARERVVIANAYFFPGYRLLQEMRRAARRGVEVRLILQGEPDMAIVKVAGSMLYHHLLSAGVRIFEYTERPLHGKVAVFDGELATVGSSNLDPLSLSLNLEANVLIKDRAFNQDLSARLERLIERSCKQISAADLDEPSWWRVVRSFFVFHLLSHYPAWAGWLPAHAPRITLAGEAPPAASGQTNAAGADPAQQSGSTKQTGPV